MLAAEETLAPSPYRKKLIQEVQRKLRKALDGPAQRPEVLRQLFTDLALEVDSRAQGLLYGVDGDGGLGLRPREWPLCFYEVLAEHYARMPEDGVEVLPLFVKLWSQPLAARIFTLLFYRWLFEVPTKDSGGYVRYSTAFVEGASSIFWIDLESNLRRFFPLFNYTLNEVFMNSERNARVPSQALPQLVLTLSRFLFFYKPAAKLEEFFAHFPPSSHLGPADVFVIELTDQLQKVKVEPVLLDYLESAKTLKGVDLRVPTSTRLRTALHGFTSPGGPMYPTRAVRHAAWETLDGLFPVGRNSRHLISLFFRLMHPYYWPMSFWNFVVTSIIAIVQRIYLFLLSIWKGIIGRR